MHALAKSAKVPVRRGRNIAKQTTARRAATERKRGAVRCFSTGKLPFVQDVARVSKEYDVATIKFQRRLVLYFLFPVW